MYPWIIIYKWFQLFVLHQTILHVSTKYWYLQQHVNKIQVSLTAPKNSWMFPCFNKCILCWSLVFNITPATWSKQTSVLTIYIIDCSQVIMTNQSIFSEWIEGIHLACEVWEMQCFSMEGSREKEHFWLILLLTPLKHYLQPSSL